MEIDKSQVTILIVDDTPENIEILAEYLSEYKVKAATDGEKALKAVDANPVPTIILLDIMMPDMDGFEVCKRLKQNQKTKNIPVIFITALSDIEDKVKGFQIGAVDYITKPFQIEEVKSRIEAHLALCLYRRELESVNQILEQKVQERTRELVSAKEKAEEANKLKSHFLSLISHELRTPMAGILGFSEVLLQEIQIPEQKEFAKYLSDSAQRLKTTIESILTLPKLESESICITPTRFNVHEEADKILVSQIQAATGKGLKISIGNTTKHDEVVVDLTMFELILKNVVGNAIKFTEKGSIHIEFFDEEKSGSSYLCFSVEDTGIGIPEDKQQVIFEEFRQVYEGMERNFEGVGLGLSLVKKYVEASEGILHLESTLGRGSTFTIWLKNQDEFLPASADNKNNEYRRNKNRTVTKIKPRVLIVEDDFINVQIATHYTRNVIDLDVAMDGATALEMTKKITYQAILMDINLGRGLSGIEVTKIIKKMEPYKNIPVIACTAYAMDSDKKNFIEQGCSHYLAKPYSEKQLMDLLEDAIQ